MRIFTEENFHDISKMMEEVRQNAVNSKDEFHRYDYERLCIMGDELFERFCQEYHYDMKPSWWGMNEQSLKNKSTIAEIVTCYHIEYHYDARSESSSWDRDSKCLCVKIDGEYLHAWFYKSKAAEFSFLNDARDYRKVLPYNWEEEHPEPNRASELTDKKVQAWLDWLRLRRLTYDTAKNERDNNVAKFLERVKIASSMYEKYDIRDDGGYIEANNIKYRYTISDGVIHEEIKLAKNYHEDTLAAFIKMSTGKYDE